MLKKEFTIALAMIGVTAPFITHADQSMSSTSKQPAYQAGEMVRTGDLPGAYNQNASYKLEDSYDVYFTADFIYWNLQQDLVRVGNLMTTDSAGALGLLEGTDETVFTDGKYTPGFQVGLGFNMKGMDDWNLYTEYTWYQNTNSRSVNAGDDQVVGLSYAQDGAPSGITDDIVVAESATTKSKYHYNNLNISLQRPFYFGRKLIANFGAGLRGLWIAQTITNSADDLTSYHAGAVTEDVLGDSASTSFHQKMWGIGPRFEFGANWLFGLGFRMMTDIAASVLYSRYTDLSGSVSGSATHGVTAAFNSSVSSNYNTLRAITETSLGLGWGSYFGDNNDFHFDLSASYEFNVYWNQNMLDMVINGNGSPGNTYLQGLNVAARFDF